MPVNDDASLSFGPFRLDHHTHTLFCEGEEVGLGPYELVEKGMYFRNWDRG